MFLQLRIKLARWILGQHCSCYQMGYHPLVDFRERSCQRVIKQDAKNS
ncbi:MAG: hypothetical protein RIQ84_662 [Pseudomonadota bacterium]